MKNSIYPSKVLEKLWEDYDKEMTKLAKNLVKTIFKDFPKIEIIRRENEKIRKENR